MTETPSNGLDLFAVRAQDLELVAVELVRAIRNDVRILILTPAQVAALAKADEVMARIARERAVVGGKG